MTISHLKKRDTKKKSEIYEINDVDSTIDPMILNNFDDIG